MDLDVVGTLVYEKEKKNDHSARVRQYIYERWYLDVVGVFESDVDCVEHRGPAHPRRPAAQHLRTRTVKTRESEDRQDPGE